MWSPLSAMYNLYKEKQGWEGESYQSIIFVGAGLI